MKTTKRAARPTEGFMHKAPPLSRANIADILSAEISDESWQQINAAYIRFARNTNALSTSRASKKKDAPEGWWARQAAAEKSIQSAMAQVDRARKNHGNFLHEASDNYSIENFGIFAPRKSNARAMLDEAYMKLLHASAIVERASSQEFETPTNAECRRMLVRELAAALPSKHVALSDGRTLRSDASESDLTPFEQLISALEIHLAETPSAHARWVRNAIGGSNPGS